MSGRQRPVLRDQRRQAGGGSVALVGTLVIHGVVGGWLFVNPSAHNFQSIPVYNIQLVAAPRPEPEARPAPEAVERPAAQPAPAPPQRNTAAEEAPPPERTEDKEPAPRTTPEATPLPDEEPSTGEDPATLTLSGGVNFPYPEYLNNIVAQIYRRWQRPAGNESLRAEVFFLVRRDGSISSLRFVQRSGNFAFDLEAQGAIEAAGTSGAFGPLPPGFEADILPVSFFFDPSTLRR